MDLMSTFLFFNENNAKIYNILTGLETVCNYGYHLYHVNVLYC